MELVYLWIEDYKNIQKQGFNFSPRFSCEYDDIKKELTIKENDDYIENFFGENINITAIVGKNGSGKSSICNILNDLDNQFIHFKYIFIIELDKVLKCFTNLEIENNLLDFVDLSYVYELPSYGNDYGFKYDKCRFYENFTLLRLDYKNSYIRNNDKLRRDTNIENVYNLSIRHVLLDDNFELTTFMSTPKIITVTINNEFINHLAQRLNLNKSNFIELYEFIINYKNLTLLDLEVFCELLDSPSYSTLSKEEFIEHFNLDRNQIQIKNNDLLDMYLQTIYIKIEKTLSDYGEELYEVYLLNQKELKLDFNEMNNKILSTTLDYFNFDFEDDKKRKFSDLSHGEQSIYSQFVYMYTYRDEKILYILDEPDLLLHPEWQKRYISEFIKTFSSTKNQIHLLVTSHSPFLLSDIPKQNIIFLDKDEKERCIVVDGIKETFGQNIHTLLSDSFFISDGLMGEFAKAKISEIKKLYQLIQNENVQKRLEEEKTKELAQKAFYRRKKRLWQIQKIIGEPFLQKVIKNYLDELEIFFSDDKTLIVKELVEIEERKKYLEVLQKRIG